MTKLMTVPMAAIGFDFSTGFYVIIGLGLLALIITIIIAMKIFKLRRVVSPKQVHVVRQGSKTLVYGKLDDPATAAGAKSNGNTYYEWPVWIPKLGVDVSKLPLSVFDIDLTGYEAYDKERLPFVVDVKAFFRISDYMTAASRIKDLQELENQLTDIVRGAVRTILANVDLETIMGERSEYGDKFTNEVKEQLAHWGVETVKNIELMDIRDAKGEEVIANIMKKKKSEIEKDSRVKVAENERIAKEAEIKSEQEIELKEQAKRESVGMREAEVTQKVGIQEQKAAQKVQEETKTTREKEMEVKQVEDVRKAEIEKQATIINADAAKEKTERDAEANKIKVTKEAEANKVRIEQAAEAELTKATKDAEGIKAVGEAKAAAEEKMNMAAVTPQLTLAEQIGENEGYQKYLIEIRKVEANEAVGMEQAKNLGNADIKIVTGGNGTLDGLNNAVSALSPAGSGINLGGQLEGLLATPAGQELLKVLQGFSGNIGDALSGLGGKK